MAWYCDTSALAKLIVREPESVAFNAFTHGAERVLVTSELTISELGRASRRKSPSAAASAESLLESFSLLALSRELLESAGRVLPRELRTLDALHLASALSLGRDCEGVVTYDKRMQDAALAHGLPVLAPGQIPGNGRPAE